ncbi:MAG: DUF3604 domain-containing protein [Planctomycetes bacterium]|nr:DUF3604 domain-containing protein [Planctomycetota bacterium]
MEDGRDPAARDVSGATRTAAQRRGAAARGSAWRLAAPLVLLAAVVLASREAARTQETVKPNYPDGAAVEQHERMVADKRATYGLADGGGSARVVEGMKAVAGGRGRFLLEYTAGERGIAVGGALFLQISPFWGWTTPQVEQPLMAGFTQLACSAAGVRLVGETVAPQCLQVRIADAPLPAGATVTLDYGSGPEMASVDRFAESEEAFYFWVDGDGDGTRKLIAKDPTVAIAAGPPSDLLVTVPSEVAIGGEFEVTLAFLDASANAAPDFIGEVALAGAGLELPATVKFGGEQRGRARVRGKAVEAGIRFVVATVDGLERASNPLLVGKTPRTLLWADLHGHSQLSDGTATPEEYYDYARNVAALDVAVLTDHDHWGMRKLDMEAPLFERIAAATRAANDPGRFTTLHGLEWTSWIYGHRHVLWFDDAPRVISSLDAGSDTPQGLWQTLRASKADALTVPHHSGGGPVPTDWTIAPDPQFEPLVEIVSVHGSSEEPRGPRTIYAPRRGHFVRDALRKGYVLGFLGSGDSHNGHPGLAHLGQPCGGLTAILAADNTRASIATALRERTCYATSGPRILLWFRLGSARMGAVIPIREHAADGNRPPTDSGGGTLPDPNAAPPYLGLVIGTAPLKIVEIVKNGAVVATVDGNGAFEKSLEWRDDERAAGDFVYLRAIQTDGHAAWSSPIFTR